MANKRTTGARTSSKVRRAKPKGASKRLAGSAVSQSSSRRHKSAKHIVSPLTANEILRDVLVTKRDLRVARKTVAKVARKGR